MMVDTFSGQTWELKSDTEDSDGPGTGGRFWHKLPALNDLPAPP